MKADRRRSRVGSGLVAALFVGIFTFAPPARADHLACQGRTTTIDGGSGNETITGTPGDDVINADAGNDRIDGAGGSDVICGGDGNDRLVSAGGVDVLDGGAGNDRLAAGAGDDVLFGMAGSDRMDGQGGNDAFIGGPGDDQLRGGEGFADQAQYFDAPNGVDANLATGVATGHGTDTFFDIERLVGSNFDDILTGDAADNSFIGMLGDDIIDGGAGFDGVKHNFLPDPVVVDLALGISTGQGSDQLISIEAVGGTIGDDLLLGSDGPDSLTGREGDDHIEGRGGNDDLAGNEGEDFLDGGEGTDIANGGPDSDTCVAAETTIDCEGIATSIATVDSAGLVGLVTDIAIGTDGLPVISYFDATNASVKVVHCGDLTCSSGNTTNTLDTGGLDNSIAIGADGLPVISYFGSPEALRVAHCADPSCTSLDPPVPATVDFVGSGGFGTSIAIGGGLPVISYHDGTNGDLKVVRCGTVSCSSGNEVSIVDEVGLVGRYSSIAIAADDGFPLVSYRDSTNNLLKVADCLDAACSTATITSPSTPGFFTSIVVGSDALPVIAFHSPHAFGGDLAVLRCDPFPCGTGGIVLAFVDGTPDNVGEFNSMVVGNDGLPVISYYDSTNGDLKVAHCGTPGCGAPDVLRVDAAGDVGRSTSIAIGSDGLPVISYFDNTNGDLKVARPLLP